jgi:hypothetical protein
MPGRDGTGSMGAGLMTGRGAGNCVVRPGMRNRNNQGGRGCGFGMGMRRRGKDLGLRNCVQASTPQEAIMSKEEEKEYLKNEVEFLEKELETAKKRIKEI